MSSREVDRGIGGRGCCDIVLATYVVAVAARD